MVLDDLYSSHRYVRIPWMDVGRSEDFCLAWELAPGAHLIEVIADLEDRVIKAARGRENNPLQLKLVVRVAHCTNKKMGPSRPQAIHC